jgi:hypothetical protein
MLKELKWLICLINVFLLISCSQKTILLVKTESVNGGFKPYAPDCYLKKINQEFLIREGFLYKNNVLQKYIVPQTESLVIENVRENGYSKETKEYKNLDYKEIGDDEIFLFKKKYIIERKKNDTIFLNDNIVIIKNPKAFE